MLPLVNIHTHRKPQPREWCVRYAWLRDEITLPHDAGYFSSIGVHPWYADRFSEREIVQRFEGLINHENLRAIGEIGLDRVCATDFVIQKKVFELQLEMAKKYNKPVIIHCVKAYSDLLYFIKKYNMPFILHDYNGKAETSKQLLSFDNAYFSFGKLLFRDDALATERLRIIPSHRLFFETDTMKVCIGDVYKKAASLLGVDPETLYQDTFDNFTRIA